jgi:Flp pilus assembly protein protease CpaA
VFLILVLLALTILVAIYDQIHAEIPNWVTWPLILVGLLAHFPGTLPTVFSSIFLIAAAFVWDGNGIGLGDAKLWLVLLWMLPPNIAAASSTMIFAVVVVTAGLQIMFRRLTFRLRSRGWAEEARPAVATRPAAWRAAIFMALIAAMRMLLIPHG